MNDIDPTIKQLEEMDPEARNQYLRLRSEAQCSEILQTWARTISIDDYSKVDFPFRNQITDAWLGNPSQGVASLGRIFTIAPTGDPVRIMVGYKGKKRQWLNIEEPTQLTAEMALAALCQRGCLSKVKHHRGDLVEVKKKASSKAKRKKKEKRGE